MVLPTDANPETVIACSWVTCAEYQPFLEAQCLARCFRQPDHWHIATAPEEQRSELLLGIRASDTQAFCRWLTEQAQGIAQYRLPTLDEWEALSSHDPGTPGLLPPGSGCWITAATGIVWRATSAPPYELLSKQSCTFANQDWERHPRELAAFSRPLHRAHHLTRLLACNPTPLLTSDLPLAIARLQDSDLERVCARTRQWTDVLERMEMLALAHASDFHRTLVSDLDGQTSLDERASMFTRVRDLTDLLGGAGDLSREILTLLQQALVRGKSRNATTVGQEAKGMDADEERTALLAALRTCTLHLACFLRTWRTRFFSPDLAGWLQHFLRWKTYANLEQKAFAHLVAGCLDLYLALVILELRRTGVLPAWEGLVLVTTDGGPVRHR